MLEIQTTLDGESATLRLSGEATVREARKIREAILSAAGQAKVLCIDSEGVTECDLSFLQILEATHRLFVREGRTLCCVNQRVSAQVRRVIERSGYFRRAQCAGSSADCPFYQATAA
jgi:anti-anti-sigma regulatory factor